MASRSFFDEDLPPAAYAGKLVHELRLDEDPINVWELCRELGLAYKECEATPYSGPSLRRRLSTVTKYGPGPSIRTHARAASWPGTSFLSAPNMARRRAGHFRTLGYVEEESLLFPYLGRVLTIVTVPAEDAEDEETAES